MIQHDQTLGKPSEAKEILTFAVELGLSMLENGAEIFRIEESIERILQSYDIKHFDVYILSNGIFASANEDQEDACSLVRHMPSNSVHLAHIAELNQLSREICDHKIDISEGWNRLKSIRASRTYTKLQLMLSCAVGSGFFCYLFGGTVIDGLCASVIGLIVEFLLLAMSKAKISRSIAQILSSMLITTISCFLPKLLPMFTLHRDHIIIGAIMVLVPGIMFTTAIRDVYNGDYLSGAIHLLDALLTALCIAAGVVFTLFLLRHFGWGVNV